jgi:predicted kinase
VFPQCPQPPDWTIEWPTLDSLPWLLDMKGCPQNPDRHAEGDVWHHVHLVTEAMVALPAWQALPETERRVLFASALLHDVAKPTCTRVETNGRVSARGHSWRGAIRSRVILWRLGVPFEEREAVCAIVRHHLVPFFLPDSENPRRLAIEVSQTARCDLLAVMAEADIRGRICPDPDKLLSQVARFQEEAQSAGCLEKPYEFGSDGERFRFFRDSTPLGALPDLPRAEALLLCGLPASGKDHWLEHNLNGWPVVSLDEIRQDIGAPPADSQGEVLTRARDLAREHLQAGRNFVWNAPNLSRHVRADCIKLFHGFGARVRIVYLEVPEDRLYAQNRQRRRRLPDKVIDRMLDRWEVPDRTEAHQVDYVLE